MNKKALKKVLVDAGVQLVLWEGFLFSGAITSLLLTYYYSIYFCFLSILFILYLWILVDDNRQNYLRYCKDEENMSNGTYTIDATRYVEKHIVNLLDGKRHGSFIQYYSNGQIKNDFNYKKGKLDGEYKEYRENGNLYIQTKYRKWKLDGTYKKYHPNGNLYIQTQYEKGKLDGEYKEYHENGNLYIQTKYKKDNKDGKTLSLYSSGDNYRYTCFKEGEIVGNVKEYFKNGNLKFVLNDNKYTFYDEGKNIKCEVIIQYSSEGETWSEQKFSFKGLWKNYRPDGTVEYELNFDDPNSDEKNKVMRTFFTKGGAMFSKKHVFYNEIIGFHINFVNKHSWDRLEEEEYYLNLIPIRRRLIGPPSMNNLEIITLKPITSIEDILKFK